MTNEYKINIKASADERVAQSVAAAVGIFLRLELDYVIFGSCGIQTYFDYFFRLPNDLDVIVRRDAVPRLKAYCAEKGHEFVEELGRSKIHVGEFPVHVIPEVFSVVNKESNSILARIDMGSFITNAAARRVNLLCANSAPKINVPPVEMCLFMDLIRAVQTNCIVTVYLVFRHLSIDGGKFAAIVQDNQDFAPTILRRLREYPDKLNAINFFSKEDILFAQGRMADLLRSIEAAQERTIK